MYRLSFSLLAALTAAGFTLAQEKPTYPKPTANSAEEPIAKALSLARSAEFLDNASVTWTRERKCGTCHTNYPYLMARPLIDKNAAGLAEVRLFFENRAANWETAKPRWDTEVVATAAALAINDHLTTGKLHPLTKKALDKMWTLQQKDGAWNWLKCNWPPMEHDDYFGAVFAALGVGLAPDGYANSESAKQGLARLRGYLEKTPAPGLHHKAWLLWASLHLDGLMTKEQQAATVKELLARQRSDGGWSLPALGDWRGNDGRKNNPDAPSDAYATGLLVYILRQAGTPANHDQLQKGVAWLKGNQRESGRWFVPSPNTDRYHFITNAGTSFAVMALKSC
jgi:squalene-hopene/tetraprenyl-beta-curcumene cyclase